jgi:hypothetical protein
MDPIAFVEEVVRRVDAAGAFEWCERRWPGQRGALEIRIRCGDASAREGAPAVTMTHGGPLAATPLGRCVTNAIAAFHQRLEVPPLRGGFLLDTTLEFPGARSLWGRRWR